MRTRKRANGVAGIHVASYEIVCGNIYQCCRGYTKVSSSRYGDCARSKLVTRKPNGDPEGNERERERERLRACIRVQQSINRGYREIVPKPAGRY